VDRTERIDSLISYLRARHYTTMGELADELGVSLRTVRRDVAALRRRGIDIEGERGRGGGIRFFRLAPLPPLRLDESQVVGLWLSVQLARRVTGLPFSEGSGTALNKVLAALPDGRRQQLRRLCDRIVVAAPASARIRDSAGEMCSTLLDAFERCFSVERCMSFQYRDRHGNTTQRRVEPHGILVQMPLWYVLAVDVDKGEPRTFRMDRISNPRPYGRPFIPSKSLVEEMVREVPGAPGCPTGGAGDQDSRGASSVRRNSLSP
jgi:predicted DNA-binding transcriptional regulator YafY